MHETKFRAWLKADNRYLEADEYNQLFLRPDGRLLWWSYVGGFEDVTAKFEIEWFTGLRDKNGKEIYGGDILDRPGCVPDDERIQREIDFAEGCFWCGGDPLYFGGLNELSEVIGNRHQNPELLEQANE